MNITIQKFKKSEPIFYGLCGKRITETVVISRWNSHPISTYLSIAAYENGRPVFRGTCLAGCVYYRTDDKGELVYSLDIADGKIIKMWAKEASQHS